MGATSDGPPPPRKPDLPTKKKPTKQPKEQKRDWCPCLGLDPDCGLRWVYHV